MKKLATLSGGLILFMATTAWAAVNVNTATAEELQTLDGVGEVKAQAIVDYRKDNGEFESKSDLTEVNGIGPSTLDGIRSEVTLDSE